MLTCIGLGKRSEKKSSKAAPSPLQQQQQAKDVHEDSEEEGVWIPQAGHYLWNPFECPQPWTPLHHTCHQPQHELIVGGGTLSLPRTTEWDRFESLIQELDSKQSDLSPPQKICSITDQQLSQNTVRCALVLLLSENETRLTASNQLNQPRCQCIVLPQNLAHYVAY